MDPPKGRKTALSFAEAATQYLERLATEGGRSIPRKAQHLKVRLVPYFGPKRMGAIQESDIRAFAAMHRAEGAAAGTVNRELATLSHTARSAARRGWIPCDKVPGVVRLQEGVGRIIALSAAQYTSLLEAAKVDQDSDLWLFVSVCLQMSMRHGEARRLRWENYGPHRRRIYIPEAGEREQPITAELANILQAVMRESGQREGYVLKGGPGSVAGYRHIFRKAFQRAVARAGLDTAIITPHVLRHTAITKLVKAGVDLPTIQRVSGHKTLSMVLRYSHVDGAHIDAAISHLGHG